MAQSMELTELPIFGDAGTTSGVGAGANRASPLLGAEAGRVHHCAGCSAPGAVPSPLPWAGASSAALCH